MKKIIAFVLHLSDLCFSSCHQLGSSGSTGDSLLRCGNFEKFRCI